MNLNKLNRFLFALAAAILLTIIIVTIAFEPAILRLFKG